MHAMRPDNEDNAPANRSGDATKVTEELEIEKLEHPRYSQTLHPWISMFFPTGLIQ